MMWTWNSDLQEFCRLQPQNIAEHKARLIMDYNAENIVLYNNVLIVLLEYTIFSKA